MKNLCLCASNMMSAFPAFSLLPDQLTTTVRMSEESGKQQRTRRRSFTLVQAAKSGAGSLNSCQKCKGQGAIECPGCKGTGRNKKNGNIFERWKCFDCQGFGLKSCPACGKGGLTPEQRGER